MACCARLEGWRQAPNGRPQEFIHSTTYRRLGCASSLCQFGQTIPFAIDHRFLLGTRPTLNLPFSRYGIGYGVKMLGKHHCDRPPCRREATMEASIVLGEPFFERLSGGADIVFSVSTARNVEVGSAIHSYAPRLGPSASVHDNNFASHRHVQVSAPMRIPISFPGRSLNWLIGRQFPTSS
jgi:hypothetical protein